jgi:hypothetical protein
MIFERNIRLGVRAIFAAFVAVVALASCSAPVVSEDFRSRSDRDSSGRYCFDLDMSDSLAAYDISFYTRIDCGAKLFAALPDIPVNVEMVSPSGESFTESVFLTKSSFDTGRPGSFDIVIDYRIGCAPLEYGCWKMFLALPDIRGLRGIGVILKSKK